MINNRHNFFLSLVSLLLCISCAYNKPTPDLQSTRRLFYPVNHLTADYDDFRPSFLIEKADKDYNLIGSPAARTNDKGEVEIFIDPTRATMFHQRQDFATTKGRYHNMIYRIHFMQVPFRPDDFHFTYGNNVGLLVIVTMNEQNIPLLVTTVHTCGCYLAFFPFDNLPADSFPDNWPPEQQCVYGINLPSIIRTPDGESKNDTLLLTIKGGSHRVSNVQFIDGEQLLGSYPASPMNPAPMEQLSRLELNGEKVSFFESEGSRKGYVKNSSKPLERLLMSWWTMDWNIGVDKAYGDRRETGTVFYTSIKFWRRNDSDMWNFADFLNYWGWKF